MKSLLLAGMALFALVGHAQTSGFGPPTFNCAVNDTYQDVTFRGLSWKCGPSPNSWAPTPAFQPFGGNGSGISAAQLALVVAESFGAVADWNGTTGTDNTVALQNAINSLQTAHTCGQVLLQGGAYKITAPLSITSSCVGFKGAASAVANPAWYTLPNTSTIITTSASADLIDVAGTSSSANVYGNRFDHINLLRSVTPTGTATGLSFNHVTGAELNTVISNDSIRGFYFHNFNSGGVGYIDNCAAELGENGVSEPSGTYYGFYIDSTDGQQSASLRMRNSAFASNATGSSVTYGLFDTGNAMNDLMVWNFETASATVGEKFLYTSGGTNFGASDIHLYGTINDQFTLSGIVVSGLTSANGAGVEISGGTQDSTSSTGAPIDIESSNGVSIANVSIGMANNTFPTGILLNGSPLNSIVGNSIKHVTANGISLVGSVNNTVTGNTVVGVGATGCLICVTGGSNQNALSGNTLAGTASIGLSVDATSTNNTGIYTNAYASTLTTDQQVNGSNPLLLKPAAGGTVISTVFNEGTVGASIIGTHPATDVPGNAWIVWAGTGDPGWAFKSGGGALGSSATQDQANIINTGISDFTLTFSGVVNTSEVLYVFRYANNGNDYLTVETLGAGGIALVENVSGTPSTVGTSAVSNGATGSIVISAVGRAITVTPFGGTPINYTIPLGHADITGTIVGMYYVHGSPSLTVGGMSVVSVATNVALMNAGGFSLDSLGNTTATSVKTTTYTVATLPSAVTLGAGSQVVVSDGAGTPPTCTGGGSNYQIAVSNGATWTCH